MSKVFFKLANGNFVQNWSNIGLITTANDWSGVESIVGYKGEGVTSGTAKDPRTVTGEGAALNIPFVLANQTSGTISNGGIAEFHLPDPTIGMKGSGSANAPQLVLYMDATGRQDLRFSVDLRDLDGSATNAVQPIAVQYRIGDSGPWINLPDGYVADATLAGSATLVTHLDITLPSAANNQSQVEIRIITTDAVGTDEFVGLDNLSVVSTALVVVADTTAPVVASSTPSDGATMVNAGANLVLNFSEQVTLGTGNVTITDNAGDTRVISLSDTSQVTLSGQTLTINPSADLKPGATYQVSLDSGSVRDLAGNAYSDSDANPLEFTVTPPLTPIYAIQGASHTSPLVGRSIITSGVVTAIDTSGTKGYWIQDATGDGNVATSDAVFVVSATTNNVRVGDLIQLQATVQEATSGVTNNLSITQLTNIQNVTVVSSGNVIAPTVLGTGGRIVPNAVIESDPGSFNPASDALDFYESLEGMLVTLKDAQIVGKVGTSTTFAVTDSGANASGMNDRGAITRSEGDSNPERIEIFNDTGVLAGLSTNYSVGDKIGNVTGVMSYFNGFYEVLPTVTPGAGQHAVISRETTTLAGDASHLTVGAYNVDNLAANSAASKIAQLASDIATNMRAPDMLGLEEVQDNNGSAGGMLASDLTMKALIDAIVAAGGPQYQFVVVDPALANSTGGAADVNIRNVILYNPARVSYVADSARQLADTNTADGDAFAGGRKPLVADFLFRGEQVTFVSVHNAERTGSDEPFGRNQPGVEVGDVRRIDQTSVVQQFVQQQLQTNPDARVVVAGDFNGYHFESSLTQLEANGALTNLVRTLPVSDRYTSSYEGNNEQLDHVLVSGKLATGAEFDNVHLNTNLATAGASDRDAVLARVFVNSAPASNGDSPNAAQEDGTLVVDAAQGVLANDTDINRDTLTAVLQDGPAHGTLVLAPDGSFTYTPVANYHGSDSFSYVARDAFGGVSPVATVQLTVSSVNDAPTLVASSPSAVLVEEGMDRAGNFSSEVSLTLADVDGPMSYDTSDWTFEAEGTYSRSGTYGTAILDTIHNKVYYLFDNRLPASDALAAGATAKDDFSVTITDGISTASVPLSFVINGSNDAPSTRGSSAVLAEDGSVTASVMRSASDVDGDAVTAVLQDSAANGTLVLAAIGSYTYTPNANFNGTDSFSYVVKDASGAVSQLARVQLTVDAVNDAPTIAAGAPSATLVEAGTEGAGVNAAQAVLQVADIDSTVAYDLAGWTLKSAGVYTRNGTYGVATLTTATNTVQYALDNARAATNALPAGAHVTDDFSITVSDGSLSASTPLSFAITGGNDLPTGASDSAAVLEDASVSINVLANDSDVDGDTISILLAGAKSDLGASISIVNGQVRYSADADSFDLLATGQSVTDRFVYTVSDGRGGVSAPIAVTVTVGEARDGQVLEGTNKADSFIDAAGRDTTYSGDNGDDFLSGGDGADVLNGDNGDDVLNGGSGSDKLDGGNGGDLLFGGAGNDQLTGGTGTDVFVFSAGDGRDTIVDFKAQNDKIVLGYTGNGSAASLEAWADAAHAASALVFTNIDSDGNGQLDAVAITGAALGDGTIVLLNWTVAELVGQHLITANNQVIGNWIS
jgi:VCBS repeat-containing protein